jgi:hypothetical protein
MPASARPSVIIQIIPGSKLVRNLLFSLLVLGFFITLAFIESTAFVVEGEKYYVLFDDAMISMRYAYNLAHGQGPVWNAGERVEGFTNPLWVGWMALVHLLPLPLSKTSLVIQAGGALLLGATLYFVRRIVELFTDDLFTMLGAVALTAFYQPLHSWDLLGMEVSLLGLILTAALWSVLKNDGRLTPQALGLLGVSTLIRFDMAVPYLVILAGLLLTRKGTRKIDLIWGLGVLVLFLAAQTLARVFYYGEWLPNTYYLKVEGWPFALRILRGLYALLLFIYHFNWALFLLPLGLLLVRRNWKTALILGVIAGQLAYSVFVGGDAWEDHGGANRYIAIAMPLFFSVFMVTVEEIRNHILNQLFLRKEENRTTKARRLKDTRSSTLVPLSLGDLVVSPLLKHLAGCSPCAVRFFDPELQRPGRGLEIGRALDLPPAARLRGRQRPQSADRAGLA